MTINEKISKIRDAFCNGDNGVFATRLGVSTQYASNICKNGKNVGEKQKQHILDVFPDVSRSWLLAGEGTMLKSRKKTPIFALCQCTISTPAADLGVMKKWMLRNILSIIFRSKMRNRAIFASLSSGTRWLRPIVLGQSSFCTEWNNGLTFSNWGRSI